MKKISIVTSVLRGKLTKHTETIAEAIKMHEGKDIKVTIERHRKNRSNPQNRYYWGVIVPLIVQGLRDTQGEIYSNEEVHEFLKANFNYNELVDESTGEVLKIAKSTTENDTFNQEEYHEKVRIFAFEFLNVSIPLPNDEILIEN